MIYSYIPRTSKAKSNSDTLQQRARFFGSKRHLRNFCKIFITEKTYEEFLEYAVNESYLFSNFNLINETRESAEIFRFDKTNPCRKGVISEMRSVIMNKWQHVYIYRNPDWIFENLLQDSRFESGHNDSGDTVNRSHLIFTVKLNYFLSLFNDENLYMPFDQFGESDEFGRINFIRFRTLSRLLLDQERITFIKLGGNLEIVREYSSKRLSNYNSLVPKSVHSGRSNDGSYVGDAKIFLHELNTGVTVHLQKVLLDGIAENKMLVLSFYYGR